MGNEDTLVAMYHALPVGKSSQSATLPDLLWNAPSKRKFSKSGNRLRFHQMGTNLLGHNLEVANLASMWAELSWSCSLTLVHP